MGLGGRRLRAPARPPEIGTKTFRPGVQPRPLNDGHPRLTGHEGPGSQTPTAGSRDTTGRGILEICMASERAAVSP
jgi:hypothetical protein